MQRKEIDLKNEYKKGKKEYMKKLRNERKKRKE